jgi:hypothetical protein
MNATTGNASLSMNTAPSMVANTTTGGAKKASVKKLLLGRERVVTKEGRASFVVISGKKVSLTKAKEMDAEWRKAKKAKESAKKAKAAKKPKAAKKSA